MRREEDCGRCILLHLAFDQRMQAAYQVQFLLRYMEKCTIPGRQKKIGVFYQPFCGAMIGDSNLYIGTYQVCINIFFPTPFADKLGVCFSQLIRWTLFRSVCIEGHEHLLVCVPQGIY